MRGFELERYFSKWEFSARYNMTASDAESLSLTELLAMADEEDRAAFENAWLGYSPTWGAPDLRAAIASTYDALETHNVLCFAGAEEGIYAAMRVMLTAADHAIVIVPNYQAAETLPLDVCDVSGVALRADDGWRLELRDVESAFRENTRLVSINFPNNPTGALIPEADLRELIELCRDRDAYLFSDEVYRLLERGEDLRLPQVADVYEKGLSLNVMSKAYGLAGLRIGWIAAKDTGMLQRFEQYKHYLSICNSVPAERLALIAIKARRQILARNRELISTNLAALSDFFSRYPDLFDWRVPEGGCVAYPRYKGSGGVDALCEGLVEEAGVLLLPARIYHSELLETPRDRFRIGFGRANMQEGLVAFGRYLDRHRHEIAA